ncbi:unnamed protein product, partial [Prorocentrum cordatum]
MAKHDVERTKEAFDRQAMLLELVARQAAEVARISQELRAAEGNGKRTVEIVEAERADKAAKAEAAAAQLDAQRAVFAQAQKSLEQAGNQTAQQRQPTSRAEEEHKTALAAYQHDRQEFDRLRKQVEEAEDAATRAEATRTETESKMAMDTSELQRDLDKVNRLSKKLKGVQAKEKEAAEAAEQKDAGSKVSGDANQSEEGKSIVQTILET